MQLPLKKKRVPEKKQRAEHTCGKLFVFLVDLRFSPLQEPGTKSTVDKKISKKENHHWHKCFT
jgi:hypothetical protein